VIFEPSLGHNDHAHSQGQFTGCAGQVIAPINTDSDADNLFLVLAGRYTDNGAPNVAPLTGRTTFVLQPKHKQAEFFTTNSGTLTQPTADPNGGGLDIAGIDQRTPANAAALLVGVNDAGLMPPGLQIDDSHTNVIGIHGQLLVRYRPDPLGIEVLSLGKVPLDGPALLVRVPNDGLAARNNEAASLYIATSLVLTNLPRPFTNEAEIFALGFMSEPFRTAKSTQP
jgi:hypothetical protein